MSKFHAYTLRITIFLILSATGLMAAATKIRVGYSYWLPNVPLDVAAAHGWFKAEGLDVTLVRSETSQAVIAGLKSGELDLATDMIGTWIECANQGQDLLLLGETDWSHGGDKIIVHQGVDLAKMSPKQIGVYLNNLAVVQFLNAYLKSRQLVLADYTLVEMPEDARLLEAFKNDKLQVTVNCDPVAGDIVEQAHGEVLATTADFPGVMPEGFAGRAKFVRDLDADDLKAFFRVWLKAVAYVNDPAHAAEVAQIASETTLGGTETYTAETLAEGLAGTPLHTPKQVIANNTQGGNLQGYFNKCLGFLIKSGRRSPDFKPKEMLFTEPLVQAAAEAEGLQ